MRRLALVLVPLILTACSSGSTAPTTAPSTTTTRPTEPTPGCDRAEPTAAGRYDRTVVSDAVERRFLLDVPDTYDGRTPMPLVFAFHGLPDDYTQTAADMRLDAVVDDFDFVLVSPSGRVDGEHPYWFTVPTVDNFDVAFVAELLDRLESELCIDATRVFATGGSNGAQMAAVLACRLPTRFAAVAPIVGAEFYDECDTGPVPVIAFHGTADPLIPYAGGGLDSKGIAQLAYYKGEAPAGLPVHAGVDEAMRRWAQHNGCEPTPVEAPVAHGIRRRTWTGCDAETVLYIADGGLHDWPGFAVPEYEERYGSSETAAPELAFEFLWRVTE